MARVQSCRAAAACARASGCHDPASGATPNFGCRDSCVPLIAASASGLVSNERNRSRSGVSDFDLNRQASRVGHSSRDFVSLPSQTSNPEWCQSGAMALEMRMASGLLYGVAPSFSESPPPAPLYLSSLIDGQSSLLSHLQIMSDRVCSRRLKRPERITISTYDANNEFSDASMDASRGF